MRLASAAISAVVCSRRCVLIWVTMAWVSAGAAAFATCVGDCDGNGVVTVSDLVRGARIALGAAPSSACMAFDRNGNGRLTVDEVVAAVNAALHGCPLTPTVSPTRSVTATATTTPTEMPTLSPVPTVTPTCTPTETPSLSPVPTLTPTCTPTQTVSPTPTITPTPPPTPVIPPRGVYQSFPNQPIQFSIGATDPQGTTLHYAATNLPAGAQLDPSTGTFSWTPGSDQTGPFYVFLTVTNEAEPPASAHGTLAFQISPPDNCISASCDPPTGCESTLLPVSSPCCAATPSVRLAHAIADCPQGRVLYVGRDFRPAFGRLQDCDRFTVVSSAQFGTFITLNIEARCMRTQGDGTVHARLETASGVIVDEPFPVRSLFVRDDGYAQKLGLTFDVLLPQGVDLASLEGAQANLTVTLTDADSTVVSTQLRLVLTASSLPDLPDVSDVPPTPAAVSNVRSF